MGDVLVKAATLLGIIALGYLARRLGWVGSTTFATLSAIAFRITLPCALLTSFAHGEFRHSLLLVSLVGLVVVTLGQVVAWLVLRRAGPRAQAMGIFHTPSCNIGLFAIPYLSTFVGPEAIIVAAMFDIGNSFAAGGIGYGWGTTIARDTDGVRLTQILRRVFSSPVFVTYLGILALGLTGLRLPAPVVAFTGTIGAANTFVAMFMIGVGLQLVLHRSAYASVAKYLGLRYAYMSAAALVVWFLLPLGHLERVTVVLILCSPIAVLASVFSQEAGLDVRVSTLMSSISVLVAIITMPTILILLG